MNASPIFEDPKFKIIFIHSYLVLNVTRQCETIARKARVRAVSLAFSGVKYDRVNFSLYDNTYEYELYSLEK